MAIERLVVCAAIRNKYGRIICGARHYDGVMHSQIMASNDDWTRCNVQQGFIDQKGVFLTRHEAYEIAVANGQIKRRVGGDDGKLFSENLY
ncbi:hypothetical protein [Methylobacter sp.]